MAKNRKINDQETLKEMDNMATDQKNAAVKGEKTNNESVKKKRKSPRDEKTVDKLLKEKDIALVDARDKYIRLYSEFENYRRRTAKEKLELINTANERLLGDLLPVIDDFERALQSMTNKDTVSESVLEGIQLIYNKFISITNQNGLKLMEIKQGDDFDSDLHDAIARIPIEDDELSGKIVDVTEKGYFLGEKVIRHAKVVIGS
jgi:molecular chaperone GrpE